MLYFIMQGYDNKINIMLSLREQTINIHLTLNLHRDYLGLMQEYDIPMNFRRYLIILLNTNKLQHHIMVRSNS